MSASRSELAADVRGLSPAERAKRLVLLWESIGRRPPDPRYAGLSDDEVVAMIKRTREEIRKEQIADRR